MKLIIGLGNPGEKYKNSRHNVGHKIIDRLRTRVHRKDLIIKKSDVFMNDSGSFVKKLVSQYPSIPVSSIYIIHDDLDIALGSYKIQFWKGPKDHKGLQSIEAALGTPDFWRVRIGVDNRDPKNRISGEEYVLQDFTSEEKTVIDKVIDEICKKLATF